ncbi:hypothetical protein GCM10010199_08610 [Dactylosporangium roseum]
MRRGDTGTTIDLHITIESGTCVLEVGNRGRVPEGGRLPTRPPDPAQANGRGLPSIAALSDGAQFVVTAPGHVLLRMALACRRTPTYGQRIRPAPKLASGVGGSYVSTGGRSWTCP